MSTDATQTPQKREADFEARVAPIAAPLGATKIGCRLTVVPPGKKAFSAPCPSRQ
jgi:hypothetical protein